VAVAGYVPRTVSFRLNDQEGKGADTAR